MCTVKRFIMVLFFGVIGINFTWQWRHNGLSSKSNISPVRHLHLKCFTLRILWINIFCCAKFHKNSKINSSHVRGISRYLGISIKRIYKWRLDLMQTQFATFWMFPKRFSSVIPFCKWPLYTLEAAERKYNCANLKPMKTYESG